MLKKNKKGKEGWGKSLYRNKNRSNKHPNLEKKYLLKNKTPFHLTFFCLVIKLHVVFCITVTRAI